MKKIVEYQQEKTQEPALTDWKWILMGINTNKLITDRSSKSQRRPIKKMNSYMQSDVNVMFTQISTKEWIKVFGDTAVA